MDGRVRLRDVEKEEKRVNNKSSSHIGHVIATRVIASPEVSILKYICTYQKMA